jgi:gliding motility-associated-like protein
MINTRNVVKTGSFYKGLFLGLLLLVTSSVFQVSAQCSCSNLTLAGATDFKATDNFDGPTQQFHGLNTTRFYGPSGATMSSPFALASTSANVGTNGYYAVVDNPSHVAGKGYPNISESMIILPFQGAENTLLNFSVAGLEPGAIIQVKVTGYWLACTCSNIPDMLLWVNDDGKNGFPALSATMGTRTPGAPFTVTTTCTATTKLPNGVATANVAIKTPKNPNNSCGVIGITKIEILSCLDIRVVSIDDNEICEGEQTRLHLDRDYGTNSLVWEKSTVSAATGFAQIPNTAGAKSILEEIKQTTWYRCTVSSIVDGATRNVVSKVFEMKAITCCAASEGQSTSRKVAYYDNFGVFNSATSYVDAWGQPRPTQGNFCTDIPGGVQGHRFQCNTTFWTGDYIVSTPASMRDWMRGCTTTDNTNNPRGGVLGIDVANLMTGVVYERRVDGLCSGKEIYFQIAFAPGNEGSRVSDIRIAVKDIDGSPLNKPTPRTEFGFFQKTGGFLCDWQTIKIPPFVLPAGKTSVYLQVSSYGKNWSTVEDLLFDDIKFMVCSPPNVDAFSDLEKLKQDTTVCGSTSLDVATKISDLVKKIYGGEANVRYLYQYSENGTNWKNIGGITTNTSIAIDTEDYPYPKTYFRVAVAAVGELDPFLGNPNYESFEDNCRSTSVSKPFVLTQESSLNGMETVTQQACKDETLILSGPTAAQEPKIVQWEWTDDQGNVLVPKGNLAADRNYSHKFSGGGSVTIYFVGYTANCSARKKFTITEKPTVTITLNQQEDCGKTTITATGVPAAGVTYAWTYSKGTPVTTTGSSVVLDSPAYSSGTINVTGTASGYCPSAQVSAPVNIKVMPPKPAVDNTTVSYQMESGNVDISADVNAQTTTAGNTIFWRYASTSSTAPGSVVTTPLQDKSSEGTFYFWVGQVTPQGCRDSIQITVVISEVPTPTVRETSVCQGKTVSEDISALVDPNPNPANYNLLWYTDPAAPKGSGSLTPPAPSTINTDVPGPQYLYVTYIDKGDPTKESVKVPIKITVIQTPTVNNPGNQTKCNSTATDAVTFAGNIAAGVIYTWTNTNAAIGLPVSGTGNIASFAATNLTNAPISGTITVTPTFNGCAGDPVSFTITVNPTPTVNKPANQAKCTGEATDNVNFSGNMAGVTYNWTNTNDAIGLAASGAGDIPSFTTINTANNEVISGTITVTPTINSCQGTPQSFTITVNPVPTVNTPADQIRCEDATVDAITFAGNITGGVTYDWTNTNTAIGLASSGVNNIPSFTATNTTTASISGTVTVTPSIGGCTGNSTFFTITVDPVPTVIKPADQIKCTGETTDAVTFSGNIAGGVAYDWTNSNTAIGLPGSGTGDIAAFLLSSTITAPVSSTITVTPEINGCSGAPVSFTITVNPTPTVDTPANQTKCDGKTTDAVNFSGNIPSGVTYNWANTNPAIGLPTTGNGNITPFTATNTTTASISGTITVTPEIGSCTGTSTSFTITVDPVPTVIKPADQIKCIGETTDAITFSGNIATGVTYGWTNSNPAIGLPDSGTGDIAAFPLNITITTPISSTITVTPEINGCSGAPVSFSITVNPTPTVDTPADQTKCDGKTTDEVIFSGNIPSGVTYNWANTNPAIGLPATGNGNITPFTATNTTTAPISGTITVTPEIGSCTGSPTSFIITVNPTPTVNKPANQTPCNGEQTEVVNFTGNMAGITYNWTNSNATIGLAAGGNGDIGSFKATNSTNAPITGTVTVTPTANSCPGTSTSFDFTVDPTPTVTKPADQTVCEGKLTDAVNFTGNITGGVIYKWTNSDPAIGLAAGGTGNIAPFTAATTTASTSSTITVTPETVTCTGSPVTFTITVTQTPTVAGKTDGSLCGAGKVVLGAQASAGQIKWYTTSVGGTPVWTGTSFTTPEISATTPYWVEAENNGCTSPARTQVTATINHYPTITVNHVDPVCEGETTQLHINPTPSDATIDWSGHPTATPDNAAGTIVTVRPPYIKSGSGYRSVYTYNVTVTDAGGLCPKPHPVTVTVDEPLTGKIVTTNPQTCEGGNVTIDAGSYNAETYSWTSSAPGNVKPEARITVSPKETTTYTLVISRGACETDDHITIEVNSKPVILLIDSIGVRDREIIHKPGTGTQPFLFGVDEVPVDNDPVKRGLAFGLHSFYIIDAAGCRSANTDLLVEPLKLFPPIYFTPNGDGYNDTWEVPGMREIYPDAVVSIYDRFGKKLTEYKGAADHGWDGTYLGRDMPTTDYWYEINIKEINVQYVGHFTLLRR